MAGKALGGIGFPTAPGFVQQVEAWAALTHQALVLHPGLGEDIQDNRTLPGILAGLDTLYGASSHAATIVKVVLLHLSFPSDPEYPKVAPLTNEEIIRYVPRSELHLHEMMLLADNGRWMLFDPDEYRRHRNQALAYFKTISALLPASL
jgi:hypothetical protein